MAKTRSPNYPAVNLEDAIESTRRFYNREKRSKVPQEVAVQALGYSGISGSSRRAISALKQYGLIDSDNKGVKISDRGLRIIISPELSKERSQAVKDAALEPSIFNDIYQTYPEGSDEAIKSYLILEKNFSEEAAEKVIRAYRDNMRFANLNKYNGDAVEDLVESIEDNALVEREVTRTDATELYTWPLAKGIDVEVRFVGKGLRKQHFEVLKKYLDIAKDALIEEEPRNGVNDI